MFVLPSFRMRSLSSTPRLLKGSSDEISFPYLALSLFMRLYAYLQMDEIYAKKFWRKSIKLMADVLQKRRNSEEICVAGKCIFLLQTSSL